MSERLFKVLNGDGSAFHGGTLDWPLPNGKPGRWVKVEGELVPCRNGLHVCTGEQLLGWLGPAVFQVQVGRERVGGGDKLVVRRARLVKQLAWDKRVARLFACDCAERALVREREAGREPDKRLWEAVRVARSYANGEATAAAWGAAWGAAWDAARGAACGAAWAAAWAAVWAAARDAAWDAARYAAWDAARGAARDAAWGAAGDAARDAAGDAARDAAWGAARDAAWGAAGDAAWDAERSWQTDRLLAYLDGEALVGLPEEGERV